MLAFRDNGLSNIFIYSINTNEIPGKLSPENMISARTRENIMFIVIFTREGNVS